MRMTGKKIAVPPLGLLTLAALLPREWKLKIIELKIQQITDEEWNWCDLVLVTGMGIQMPGILDTIKEAKDRQKFVVVGGSSVFHVPEEALSAGADIVVQGEAEHSVSQLVEAIEQQKTGLIITGSGPIPDLRNSPAPRYDLLDLNKYITVLIQFTRGCPFKCEFCDVTLMLGRKVRTKSLHQVLQELQNIYDLGWRRTVFFVDDNFIGNPGKARELLRELVPWLEERGFPFDFITQASVNLASEPEILDLMAKAGFNRVFLGIETLDTESLKAAKKVQNVKIDINQACQTINRAGMQIIAGCILGFDNEQPGADKRLIDFAVRTQIPEMFITLLQVGPGTDLWTRLEKEGRLRWRGMEEDIGSQTGLINFVPTRPVTEIVEEYIHLYQELYDPGFYVERAFNYVANMQPLPIKKPFAMPYVYELRAALVSIFKQGIVYRSRLKFWKYFLAALFKLPLPRFVQFISICVLGEHYFEFRNTVKDKLLYKLNKEGLLAPATSTTPPRATESVGS